MNKIKRKIYIVGGGWNYINWMDGREADFIAEADFVLFTGGEDVTPRLYHAEPHPETQSNWNRDAQEMVKFKIAKDLNKPMVGICRGAQFLCVMAGGHLVQHQRNVSPHPMHTYDGRTLQVNSTHHQAQWPWVLPPEDFRVLGWSKDVSPFHEGGNKEEMVVGVAPNNVEVEVCHYPKIKALGIQCHPEMMHYQRGISVEINETVKYFQNLLHLFLTEFK